ncbi:MAG: hypothetical protein EA409_07285 [Saprospirales bacterium]|nr:MAG: hypothetical protein EA409_07285 [Saprospirales bacterium]
MQGFLKQSITGGIIYLSGDTIAALIAGDFSLIRALGILFTGSTLYAWEIQTYFKWIDRKISKMGVKKRMLANTTLALIYFNPLWIARHLVIIYLFSGKAGDISSGLLYSALIAFLVNIPLSIFANFIIQNKISLKFRFWASATFSGLMAIYYSMSSIWF